MQSKAVSIGVLGLMLIGFIVYLPGVGAQIISTSIKAPLISTSTITTNACLSILCGSLNPQNNTFNPSTVQGFFGKDLGKFSTLTDLNKFVWQTSANDFMFMLLPTVASSSVINNIIYFNSTHTAYQFSGSYGSLSVFFKLAQYKVKMSIHSNFILPQSVCLPFASGNPIIQKRGGNGSLGSFPPGPQIKAGNEIFDWSDIPTALSASWSDSTKSLCLSLPLGITNIDPLALDGTGEGDNHGNTTTASCSLTTTSSPDVIMVIVYTFNENAHAFSSITNTTVKLHQRGTTLYQPDNTASGLRVYFGVASGTLSAYSITVTMASNTYVIAMCNGISGAITGNCSTGGLACFDSNVALPATNKGTHSGANCNGGCTSPVTFSTSNANDFLIAGTGNANVQAVTYNLDTGWSALTSATNDGSTANGQSEYQIVSATQSGATINLAHTNGFDDNWVSYADAIQQAANVARILVFQVNPSPNPEGGAISYSCSPIAQCPGGSPLVFSSTTSLTYAAGVTVTPTLDGQEFSGYIWNKWSGATPLLTDTINPVQTFTISSWTTTTLSSTLTANFVAPAITTGESPNYLWLLAIPFVAILMLLIARKRF